MRGMVWQGIRLGDRDEDEDRIGDRRERRLMLNILAMDGTSIVNSSREMRTDLDSSYSISGGKTAGYMHRHEGGPDSREDVAKQPREGIRNGWEKARVR